MRLCRSQGCIPAGLKERVGGLFGHSFLARSTRDIWRLSDFLAGPHRVLDLARGGGGGGGGGGVIPIFVVVTKFSSYNHLGLGQEGMQPPLWL